MSIVVRPSPGDSLTFLPYLSWEPDGAEMDFSLSADPAANVAESKSVDFAEAQDLYRYRHGLWVISATLTWIGLPSCTGGPSMQCAYKLEAYDATPTYYTIVDASTVAPQICDPSDRLVSQCEQTLALGSNVVTVSLNAPIVGIRGSVGVNVSDPAVCLDWITFIVETERVEFYPGRSEEAI